MNKKKVCYIWDENIIEQCDRLPAVIGRASMVHNLIAAYGLLNKLQVVRSTVASYEDMREFHSDLYLDHLKNLTDIDEDYMATTQDEQYGIGYDCPPVSNMFELVTAVAGGSITAAKCLVLGFGEVVINWCGGWHHAHRFGAEGFCYVNDIVIAIEKLKKKFPKILYVDLDVHHGNGVQDAYSLSTSVFTLSIHKYEPGFYPGTGDIDDTGTHTGKGYACNIPLHATYSDDTMEYVFDHVFNLIFARFNPDAIVVQTGADALARDPHGGASLSLRGYSSCVRTILEKRKPTMLLGGGGYKHTNVARLWTSLTALVADVTLDENIPEFTDWPLYGPDYTLPIETTLAKDTNKMTYLNDCILRIKGNIENYLGKTNTEADINKRDTHKVDNTKNQNKLTSDSYKVKKDSKNEYEKKFDTNKETTSKYKEKECDKNCETDVYAFIE